MKALSLNKIIIVGIVYGIIAIFAGTLIVTALFQTQINPQKGLLGFIVLFTVITTGANLENSLPLVMAKVLQFIIHAGSAVLTLAILPVNTLKIINIIVFMGVILFGFFLSAWARKNDLKLLF